MGHLEPQRLQYVPIVILSRMGIAEHRTMKKTHLPVAIVASLLLTGRVWSADVPMVAYLYSTYRPGTNSVHDETFAQLGWGSHKWRNLHVRQLTAKAHTV